MTQALVDKTLNAGTAATIGVPGGATEAKIYTLRKYVDTAATTFTSGVYWKLFNLPAGFKIKACDLYVVTAEGATATVDIGLQTEVAGVGTTIDLAGLMNDADCNGTAAQFATTGAGAYIGVKPYHADTVITALANNTMDAAQFWVIVTVEDLRADISGNAPEFS